VKTNRQKPTSQQIETAYSQAVETYIKQKRENVPLFVEKYFGWKGSADRHKIAIGWDLLKAPANLIWSVPVLILRLTGKGLGLAGWKSAEETLDGIWPGFRTAIQIESERLIYQELLELPWKEEQIDAPKNALFEAIFNHAEISEWVDSTLREIVHRSESSQYRERLEKNLQEFATAQVSAADIGTNLIILAGTYVGAQKFASGAYGAGTVISSILAQNIAVQSFWAGPTLGGLWYGWFPAQASIGLTVASVAGVAIILAIFSSFAGMVVDPIQKFLGLHQRRLNRALDDLNADLNGTGSKGYSTKAPIVARIIDVIDILHRAVIT
jgi:hypothetical protein